MTLCFLAADDVSDIWRRDLTHRGCGIDRYTITPPHLRNRRMMLCIVGLFAGATFGLMFSRLVQGCRHVNSQETDRLEVDEKGYMR